ncbi:MAG: hypothetical protein DRI81_03760 [Chloroflexi bacterium]|nr:MAG: hypothetical protein DRI81_03760 [Chloroflexota bacterium]
MHISLYRKLQKIEFLDDLPSDCAIVTLNLYLAFLPKNDKMATMFLMNWMRKHYLNMAVLGIYCILTIAMTWPLPAQMSTHLAGNDVDVWINPWADWWTKKALTERLDFYHTAYMFYPRGISLVFHSFSHANTTISLLLAPLVGYFTAYNLAILLTYALSGFGMYLLANHLTACRPAAFVSGVVFAFHPYHLFQSSHPVLVTTQFMPLFALAFVRILYNVGVGQTKQTLLAALWFLLTALSSWHLMLMLAGWATLYLLYNILFERDRWVPGTLRHLILLIVVVVLAIAPFLWPIVREQLTTDASYMTVSVEEGRGNDLLSFFVPNQLHPAFGRFAMETNSRIGYTRNWPAYLGYTALGLAIVGVAVARRMTRFWWLTGLVFFVFSLGSQVKWGGTPLHTFHLPWAIPITGVLRHPFRLNTLLFLSLATLLSFGSRWLYRRIARQSNLLAYSALAFMTSLVLFEYLVYPFPTTQIVYSPFLHQLAQEERVFAIVDFPMGRQEAKHYLFFQTIHGQKIVDGVVSRTPDNAYAFVDANPLLESLHTQTVPAPDLDIQEQFIALADQGIRYIVVHKDLIPPGEMQGWEKWLAGFPPPSYQDESIVAYATYPKARREFELTYQLGVEEGLVYISVSPVKVTQGGSLFINLRHSDQAMPGRNFQMCLALVNKTQNASQKMCLYPVKDGPASKWPMGIAGISDYVFQVDPHIPGDEYTLAVKLLDLQTKQSVGEAVTSETIIIEELPRVFSSPKPQQAMSVTLGQDLRLLGYDVAQTPGDLRLTLYWQAERQIQHYYKFFTHLLNDDTSELAAQADVVPHDWTYPTIWWEAGEVVSDTIQLPLTNVPPGTYHLVIGVYDPETGERLPVTDATGERLPNDQIKLLEKIVR